MAEQSIILFDGVCNLCNGAVQFVIRHDPLKHFVFASLQSEEGERLLNHYQLNNNELKSFILVENGRVFTRSTAALRVARKLNKGWPMLYWFIIVPRFIRDGVYNLIARNRYKWFGKQESCMVPGPELKTRFLNEEA